MSLSWPHAMCTDHRLAQDLIGLVRQAVGHVLQQLAAQTAAARLSSAGSLLAAFLAVPADSAPVSESDSRPGSGQTTLLARAEDLLRQAGAFCQLSRTAGKLALHIHHPIR